MDQAILVKQNIDDGEQLLRQLSQEQFEPVAACWIKDSEDMEWLFYIGSEIVDHPGPQEAYRILHEALAKLPKLSFESGDIRLIRPQHSIAVEVQTLQQKYPAPIPTRFRLARLGDLSIEEAYIYPPVAAVSPVNT